METLKTYLEKHYSKTATGGYEHIIKRYLSAVPDAEKSGYAEVVEYIGFLRKQQLHPKSLRNHLFAIKLYYRYLIATGKREDHPCEKLYLKDKINRSIAVESLYSQKALEELLKSHRSKDITLQKRNEVVISLLIYQALTVREITALKIEDINLEMGTIHIKSTIKNKGRTLSLKPQQIMLFYHYLHETRAAIEKRTRTKNNFFILSKYGTELWPGGINRLINEDRKPHEKLLPLKIRQSVIAHHLKQNTNVRVVQVFAGHRRSGSTEEYKQSGLEELKASINKLHPLQ